MSQEQIQQQRRAIVRPVIKEPRRYKVIVLNDDFTTFDFVIMVMMTVFLKTEEEAYEIAESTHINQSAIVGIYTLDIARSRVDKATKMARDAGFPLKFDIKAE